MICLPQCGQTLNNLYDQRTVNNASKIARNATHYLRTCCQIRDTLPLYSKQTYPASSSLLSGFSANITLWNPLAPSTWKNWTSCANIPHARTHTHNFPLRTVKPIYLTLPSVQPWLFFFSIALIWRYTVLHTLWKKKDDLFHELFDMEIVSGFPVSGAQPIEALSARPCGIPAANTCTSLIT